MNKKKAEIKVRIVFVVIMSMCLLMINSPFMVAAGPKSSGTLFIIGNSADESPISGVEIEISHQKEDGTVGEKIGNFTSHTEKSGEGYISANLAVGKYCYRVVSEGYRLTGEEEWETFEIGREDQAVLLWVSPAGDDVEIKDEEVAKGAPEVELNRKQVKRELKANTPKEHQKIKLGWLKFLDISNNVWLTLGVLAGMIAGVIGLDYVLRLRRH